MVFLFSILLVIFTFLEGTVTTLPLLLVLLLCLTIVKRDAVVFPVAFGVGLFLDVLTAKTVGLSSIFFILFVFLILLYQRKYEINSYPFVFFASFVGSSIFLLFFGYGGWFLQAIINSFIALVLFGTVRYYKNNFQTRI